MSPDEQAIVAILRECDASRARCWRLRKASRSALRRRQARAVAGLIAAVAYVAWRWQDSRRHSIVEAAEQRHPELRNLLITWNEISDGNARRHSIGA